MNERGPKPARHVNEEKVFERMVEDPEIRQMQADIRENANRRSQEERVKQENTHSGKSYNDIHFRMEVRAKILATDQFVSEHPRKAQEYAARWTNLVTTYPEIANLSLPDLFSWEERKAAEVSKGIALPSIDEILLAKDISMAVERERRNKLEHTPPETVPTVEAPIPEKEPEAEPKEQKQEPNEVFSVKDQKLIEEMREAEINVGELPASARNLDISVKNFHAPQYGERTEGIESMQKEMDSLSAQESLESPAPAEEKVEEMGEKDEESRKPETPKEWKEELCKIIMDHNEAELIGMGRMSEKLRKHLAERSKELDTNSDELGPQFKKWINEKIDGYNKLHWAKKLGMAGALMAATALTSSAAPAVAGVFTAGLYGQRVLGGIGAFKNRRKGLEKAEWAKNKSNLVKNLYAGSMAAFWTLGTSYVAHEAVVGLEDWLGHILKTVHDQYSPLDDASVAERIQPVGQVSIVPEVAAPHVSLPTASASPGHGYEYMAKRLWEELHQQQAALPANADPNSDLYAISHADAKSIDGLVHQLATKHGFFHSDGTSAQVDPSAHLTIGADGNLHFGDATHPDMVNAAEGMGTTPAPHLVEVPTTHAVHSAITPEAAHATASPLTESGAAVTTAPPTPEAPYLPMEDATHLVITNHFGIPIAVDDPHFYISHGLKHPFVYGGTPLEQAKAIQEYLLNQKPGATVLSADDTMKYVTPWKLVDGKAMPGDPLMRGFFRREYIKPPDAEYFEKMVK